MIHLELDKTAAELNFIRKIGQLKYLSHLKQTEMIEDCPVCKSIPTDKVNIVVKTFGFYVPQLWLP